MKNNKEFIEILDGILLKQSNSFIEIGAKYSLDNYAFCCGNKWNTGLKEFKGIPIYYFNDELMKDIIQLIPSPMMKDYER